MTVQNKMLSDILDDAPAPEVPEGAPDEADLHEEHMKRVEAEGAATAAAARLAVAQQQFTEFLGERAATEEALAAQAARLEAALTSADPAALAAEAARLREGLAAAALEVRSAAAQMAAEASRAAAPPPKRSSSSADLGGARAGGDVDMKKARSGDGSGGEPMTGDDGDEEVAAGGGAAANGGVGDAARASFRERAKYIPVRLDAEERRMLRLLEGALNVSEYTDKVDVLSYRSKAGRVHAQIKDLCAILCGLTVAQNFKRGQALLADRDFDTLDTFFQDAFEVGRRYKVMNPERMRDTYGKLVYMLMDAADPAIVELLGFRCVRPLRTVAADLEAGGAAAMLDDPLMAAATAEIAAEGRPRAVVQRDIKAKERAREALARKYRTAAMDEEALLRCLYSIGDNNSFLAFARDPVDRMIGYLTTWFTADAAPSLAHSLAIQGGAGGARLTHSHSRQYTYVLQSLTLWREIAEDAFKLWYLAEGDMLAERNGYRLQNTGQGLQRVQAAPRVGRAMAEILGRCQRRIGSWVGSSVVHLGDHNVPTALHFLDKYAQVPMILNPVVLVLDEIPRLDKDSQISAYLTAAFGGAEACRREIMTDFFRHAFDGSGADNFFDAGSCIDGRLTSAWNWCAKIEKKRYYPVFKLAGFVGFNGDFKA